MIYIKYCLYTRNNLGESEYMTDINLGSNEWA